MACCARRRSSSGGRSATVSAARRKALTRRSRLGLHYCLEANLGKLETRLAVEELARRYPRLSLAGDQRLTFHPNISFRGPQALRVRTGPR